MQMLQKFWHDRSGAFAPISALVLVFLLGLGALAIDMGFNYYTRNKLQVTADAAALAGASQLPALVDSNDQQPMKDEANYYAEQNMAAADYGDVLVPGGDVLSDGDLTAGNWDPATRTFVIGVTPYNAVQAITRRQEGGPSSNEVPAFLGGIAGFSSYDISARAIATYGQGDDLFPGGCIVATSEHEAQAFYIFGTADITATDCSIEVASDAECAMHAHGTPTITQVEGDGSQGISVGGTYCQQGTVDINPPPTENQGDVGQDPYRNSDPCNDGGGTWSKCTAACDYTNFRLSGGGALSPGVYCGGITLTGNGTVTLGTGDYIIREGSLDVGSNVAFDGSSGVGFYLQGTGSTVDFGGTSDVTLVAQNGTGSPLDGFIFFEDQSKNPKETHTLRGTNGGSYEGVLYFSGDVELKGTADGGLAESDCTVLIASTLYFNGTTGLNADSTCSNFGGPPPGVGDLVVRLVD